MHHQSRRIFIKAFFYLVVFAVLSFSLNSLLITKKANSESNLLIPNLTATKTSILDSTNTPTAGDLKRNGVVNPGDRLLYTITIPNAGEHAATGVTLTDQIDLNTTLLGGSVIASPIAVNDAFSSIGNVGITVPDGASDLLSNDLDANNPGVNTALVFTKINNTNFSSGTPVATTNGSVTINSNGSFSYLPNPGFEGSDTFTYTLGNNTGLTDTSTVSITVSGMVWFVNSAAATNGNGTLNLPFNCYTVQLVSARLRQTTRAITSFFTTATIRAAMFISMKINRTGRVCFAGFNRWNKSGKLSFFQRSAGQLNNTPTNISITTSAAATNAINLGQGNTLRGFTIGNTTGSGISGSGFGTLTIGAASGASDVSINGNGQALNLTNGAIAGVGFASITSSGGTNNISLTTITGTLTLGSGALSGSTAGATNHAFLVSGGNATITYSGNITKATAGNVINIASKTGGGVTLSGTINGTSSSGINVSNNTGGTIDFNGSTKILNTAGNAAVTLSSNTGATINFSNGGLDIDTTSGAGFSAIGGGTISVTTGTNANTIDSTTGTALNVANTTIGASNLISAASRRTAR